MSAQGNTPVASTTPESEEPLRLTPPTPDELDAKIPSKRERELSLEPSTSQSSNIDDEEQQIEHKDRHVLTKKSRVVGQLDVPEEEEEDDEVLRSSPPYESKIRAISQGVEDLSWQNMPRDKTPDPEEDREMDRQQDEEQEEGDAPDKDHEMQSESPEPPEEVTTEAKVVDGEEAAVPSALLQGDNPPVVNDDGGHDEHASEADPAEVPPDASPSDAQELNSSEVYPEVSSTSITQPVSMTESRSRSGSESGADQGSGDQHEQRETSVSEKSTTSETPHVVNGVSTGSGASKRRREERDTDENPRVAKRPTPPPDQEREAELEEAKKAAASLLARSQTPPPKPVEATSTSTPKTSGFMAYASSNSPFASVKGPSLFKSPPSSSSPWASASSSANEGPNGLHAATASPFPSHFGTSSPSRSPATPIASPATKRSGFEAFASNLSIFASAAKRPKSPPLPAFGAGSSSLARSRSPSHPSSSRPPSILSANAFSAYASAGKQSFSTQSSSRSSPALGENTAMSIDNRNRDSPALSVQDSVESEETKKEEESEESSRDATTFGERLRSQKDEEDSEEKHKQEFTEQEVITGEEDEETIYQCRAKLYALNDENWAERGTGQVRINVRRDDPTKARLIMRKDSVYTVLLNTMLVKGMTWTKHELDTRFIRFAAYEKGGLMKYNLRLPTLAQAEDFYMEIEAFTK
ncbi:uncharacterized protein LAESUDRAFT_725127 [Laetiporus sulphureus 93-53]|uniref:RanBD1 domain-containing protein n=1 Tax=Laetiporus sulphureus 93-53 TaxID=1314785 RepID=A0A165EK64_9APHY|nr:uncharacterized protein LAESUDRAFT_725127 [Laetiporus sulphureus 93-53]KZT07226.1 hypothetical protein LAESUDRAFT_725127 [Laetiporus sulphureus 93-53]